MENNYVQLAKKILLDLCVIPAPSGREEKRAEYILNTFEEWGIDAYVDNAKNVVCEYPGNENSEITVFAAHTDTVFPDMEPFEVKSEGDRLLCPGIGDDTVAAAILMTAVKKLHDENIAAKHTVVFALNSCEEGLGNLRGTREIMKSYGHKVKQFVTFDGQYTAVVNKSVGSHRYRVTVKTTGGHSFNDFGNTNAAAVLAEIIGEIYRIRVPQSDNKTTYNVGIIEGGTSVNTIIQEASMLCEYRSDDYDELMYMESKFAAIFDKISGGHREDAEIIVDLVGERPCMKEVDGKSLEELTALIEGIQKKHGRCDVSINSGSTDCNIPHSMGIPAVCAGCYRGGGAHTREEWLDVKSIAAGFDIAEEIIRTLCF